MKPILFNTEMVRAILDGRKTTTRRVIKGTALEWLAKDGFTPAFVANPENHLSLYLPGDTLYVRETWRIQSAHRFEMDAKIEFKAGGPMQKIQFSNRDEYDQFIQKWWNNAGKYHPSIHMPREAARIFLRVTEVRAERLQEITEDGAKAEGAKEKRDFIRVWNNTIPDKTSQQLVWSANPWVWVISFERCEKR